MLEDFSTWGETYRPSSSLCASIQRAQIPSALLALCASQCLTAHCPQPRSHDIKYKAIRMVGAQRPSIVVVVFVVDIRAVLYESLRVELGTILSRGSSRVQHLS